MTTEPKPASYNYYIGVGLVLGGMFGCSFGVIIGSATDNMSFWLPIGLVFGNLMGMLIAVAMHKKRFG